MAQVTKAQLVEQLETLRVRCEQQKAEIASLRASLHAQVDSVRAAVQHVNTGKPLSANRRYTTRSGEVYEVVPELVGGRVIKTHKLVGMAGAH